MTDGKIKVLVAEDSTVIRMFLVHLLESDPRISVIGATQVLPAGRIAAALAGLVNHRNGLSRI